LRHSSISVQIENGGRAGAFDRQVAPVVHAQLVDGGEDEPRVAEPVDHGAGTGGVVVGHHEALHEGSAAAMDAAAPPTPPAPTSRIRIAHPVLHRDPLSAT
jgi:hypothetical protein